MLYHAANSHLHFVSCWLEDVGSNRAASIALISLCHDSESSGLDVLGINPPGPSTPESFESRQVSSRLRKISSRVSRTSSGNSQGSFGQTPECTTVVSTAQTNSKVTLQGARKQLRRAMLRSGDSNLPVYIHGLSILAR